MTSAIAAYCRCGVFLAAGLWLLVQFRVPGAGPIVALLDRWRNPARGGVTPCLGLLLLPVTAMVLLLLGPREWFGKQYIHPTGVIGLDTLAVAAALVLVFRSRLWSATLAEAGLLVLGVYGLLAALGAHAGTHGHPSDHCEEVACDSRRN